VLDKEQLWGKYVKDNPKSFGSILRALKFKMKDEHSIVEKWPMGLKLDPNEPGAVDEFKTLLGCPHTGLERYVEWTHDLKAASDGEKVG
jgi:hypothetical protein